MAGEDERKRDPSDGPGEHREPAWVGLARGLITHLKDQLPNGPHAECREEHRRCQRRVVHQRSHDVSVFAPR